MSILELENVSIRFITGDFKEIGLKEYVPQWIKHNYHVTEFWADRDVTVTLEAGDMLGYTRKFTDERYGEIVAFAELKEFEDRPFKQVSSGMKSRLAFFIASLVQRRS